MTEETTPKKTNWFGVGLILCIVVYLFSTLMIDQDNKRAVEGLTKIIEAQNQKADSLMMRQKLYEEAIDRLRYSINENQMEVRTVEKEKTKIYNNYIENVVDYKPDSTIEEFYLPRATKFDSLLYSGWFVRE